MAIGSAVVPEPVALAPMAGITDAPLRAQVAQFGVGLVVSEMVAAQEFVRNRANTRKRASLGTADLAIGCAVSVQIAGRSPAEMAETARAAAGGGAAIIDINMGCPAKKVTGGATGGSALMREPDLALRIIDAVIGAVAAPVTLKMRLGWDAGCMTGVEIARRAEAAGVAMLAIHGRTRQQFFKGRADWAAVRPIVDAVSTPVFVNGDITDPKSAAAALAASGAAGVMVGRAAQARPWEPGRIAAALRGEVFHCPGPSERVRLASGHYEAMLSHYGDALGLRAARKHLKWRLGDLMDALDEPWRARFRARLLRSEQPSDVISSLTELASLFEGASDTTLGEMSLERRMGKGRAA
ncbi:MAG: tRNA-dihydrouridine synthase [Pseudomonadota bacterium]